MSYSHFLIYVFLKDFCGFMVFFFFSKRVYTKLKVLSSSDFKGFEFDSFCKGTMARLASQSFRDVEEIGILKQDDLLKYCLLHDDPC